MQSSDVAFWFFQAVGAISLFTFLSIAMWLSSRKKEREAYYKGELMKRIAESGSGESHPALAYLREEERIAEAKRLAGFKIGAVVNIGVGLGVMVFLHGMVRQAPVYLMGVIPLLVGVGLLVYVFGMAPKAR